MRELTTEKLVADIHIFEFTYMGFHKDKLIEEKHFRVDFTHPFENKNKVTECRKSLNVINGI